MLDLNTLIGGSATLTPLSGRPFVVTDIRCDARGRIVGNHPLGGTVTLGYADMPHIHTCVSQVSRCA